MFFCIGAIASGLGIIFLLSFSFALALFFIFAGLETLLFFSLSKKYGKKPEITESAYVREIPYDYGPAIASFILDMYLKEDDITATFLDLVRRGYFKIEEIGHKKYLKIFGKEKDYLITRLKRTSKPGLKTYEEAVYKLYTEHMVSDSIQMSQLALKVYLNPKYELFIENWEKLVEEDVKKLKLVDFTGLERFVYWTKIIFILNFILAFFLFIPTIGFSIFSLFFIALFYGILVSKYKKYLMCYTELGTEHFLKWSGLKMFIKDFSILKERPPKFLIIWDKYLVYATAFGLGEEVENYASLCFPGRSNRKSALGVLGKPYVEFSIPAWNERLSIFDKNMTKFQTALDAMETTLREAELASRKQSPKK
ncbi:MAG: DUF2207 domain-containing protein [Candidatus Aenigmarchaeota archaeon]|nr:DUF2207 domain-containing protein [Candidatus Aenigmarchaeota archaeon]